ncbi:MAG: hypothetical protein R3B13_00035 [Polyangiaceae bacterium]
MPAFEIPLASNCRNRVANVVAMTSLLLLAATTSCGSRSALELDEPPAAAPATSCKLQVAWQQRFDAMLLQSLAWTADAIVVAGSGFEGNLETTIVSSWTPSGELVWDRQLEGRTPLMVRTGNLLAVASSVSTRVKLTFLGEEAATVAEHTIEMDADLSVERVLPAPNGVYVFGTLAHYPSSVGGAYLSRVDAAGNELWRQVIDPPGKQPIRVVDAVALPDGGVVYGIQRWLDGDGGPLVLTALEPDGSQRWKFEDSARYERGGEFVLLPNAGGVIAGGTLDAPGIAGSSVRVVSLGASGAVQWTRSLDDGQDNQQLVNDGTLLGGGGMAFVGYSASTVQNRFWRLQPSGEVAWARDYPLRSNSGGPARVRPLEGGLLVGAAWSALPGPSLAELRVLDADGNQRDGLEIEGEGSSRLTVLETDAAGRFVAIASWFSTDSKQSELVVGSARCE